MDINKNQFKRAEQREFSLIAGGISIIILIVGMLAFSMYNSKNDYHNSVIIQNQALKRQVVDLIKDNMKKDSVITHLRQWHRVILNDNEATMFIEESRKVRLER